MSIMGATELPEIVMIGDLSENTFLSGFYGHSQPGILEKLGVALGRELSMPDNPCLRESNVSKQCA